MVSFFVYRLWQILSSQPTIPKKDGALKIGMLGAAVIGPFAIITPAKQHPEVIVQAVAARDKKKATDYAKKHGIPQVFDSYQALLDDPNIDAVYIPLPNGLHYEWAVKALARGKHVLLEKPSTSNGEEAELLFRSPLLLQQPQLQEGQGKPPVLLEAFHYRFQPCWLLFMTLIDRPNITHVYAHFRVASFIVAKDDIRFKYHLSGGALMDLTYTHSIIRTILGTEPEECTSSVTESCASPPGDAACDARYDTTWRFPGGVTAEAHGDLQSTLGKMLESPARVIVQHRPVRVADDESGTSARTGQVTERTRRIEFENCIVGNLYHRITVEDEFVVKEEGAGGKVLKRWKTKEVKKAYTMQDAGIDAPGEAHWLGYRWQLEEFVNRIRGRPGTGAWVDADDSVAQMRMIDMAYTKAGLPLRPRSEYKPAEQAS